MSKLHEVFDILSEEFPNIDYPNAMNIWKKSHLYFKQKNQDKANTLVKINFLLHNSFIPATASIGRGTRLAYGGIGIVIHKHAKIGERCLIG